MTKSATDVMHDIVVSAVTDAIDALKAASKGLPNNLVRDMGAIHANTTFDDLPAELKTAIGASVRAAFNRLLKEGYVISDRKSAPPPPRPSSPPRGDRRGPPPPGRSRDGRPQRPQGPAGPKGPKGPPKGR